MDAGRLAAPLRALSAGCHASPPRRPNEGAERQPSSGMFTKTMCMKWLKISKRMELLRLRLLIQGGHLLMDSDEDKKDQHLLMDADEKDSHLLMDVG
ncbi:hypothetical protein LR48_Vigan04g098100 [Vigna angularis]|uniref:Uncharacterized protein n=1 Tax=Phaseolus angularis TaxID=3914 RepID=A0A0L9UDE7_PHAAN|nr:hypothetical protein LR48_Vigan04g098100 [Vigna angularis]